MTSELHWLTLTCLVTALMWIPYILNRIKVRGLVAALANPKPDDKPHDPWADRAMRAHTNAVENLVVFAPLVLVAHLVDIHSGVTQSAAAIYFFSRLAHYIVYILGIPVLRTLVFTVSWLAILAIALAILGVM